MRAVRLYRPGYWWVIGGSLVVAVLAMWVLVAALNEPPFTRRYLLTVAACPGAVALVAVAFAFFALRYQVETKRHPLLDVTADGIASPYSRVPAPRVPWSEVREIVAYAILPGNAQQTSEPAGGRDAPICLVVVGQSHQPLLPIPTVEAAQGITWYFVRDDVLIEVPLAEAALASASRERALLLLARIRETFAPEIARYDVAVDVHIRQQPFVPPAAP